MRKKRIGTLMAVVIAASPAAADPKMAARSKDHTELMERVPDAVRFLEQLSIALARPRTMPSGAPACGNVASRAPQPARCERPEPPRVITAAVKP
jgi:hypothetical protein